MPTKNSGLITIKRALLSVSDKTYLEELARMFISVGTEILATGGTAAALKKAGIAYTKVEDFAGSPEAFDGRIKTLTFKLQGGILFDRANAKHQAQASDLGVQSVDCVVCNFYPFEEALARGVTESELVEQIDIGGPTMVRAAAKNFSSVLVLTDPSDYAAVIAELRAKSGAVTEKTRKAMMVKAFESVLKYDRAIYEGFSRKALRYGENPHQKAYFVPDSSFSRLNWQFGNDISYNNMLDAQAAFGAMSDVREIAGNFGACAIVKHNNPCGLATGQTIAEAFELAWAGDPVSSFGGVVAMSAPVTMECVRLLKKKFIEVLIAPGFEEGVLEELQKDKKKLRIINSASGTLQEDHRRASAPWLRTTIEGGILVQQPDDGWREEFHSPTKIKFPTKKQALAHFGIIASKWIKSNAITVVRETKDAGFQLVGMGSGQPNRVDAVKRLALPKARENFPDLNLAECGLVSDAFFPFADSIEMAAKEGIFFVVQPGGSIRDNEVVAACDALGVSMLLTGKRHFRH